ncbi:MAG: hypothetical protein ACI9UA_000581 [Pseudoalteromonas tetraodonis]|jgi:hypothetical protein
MVELLMTVAIIGIISAIMLPQFTKVKKGSSKIIANEMVEVVNLGLKKFNQIAYKVTIAKDNDAATDEAAILVLLQTRDVTIPGSPFVRPDWQPTASDSTEDYRIHWAGRTFTLLKPGIEGHGLKIDFQAADYN